MKRIFKRLLSALLSVALVLPCMAAYRYPSHEEEAQVASDALYQMNLMNGVGTDENGNVQFALENKVTRAEAIVMLVRLVGKEGEAKAGTWTMPFTDVPEWAAPYVGYAYANGLTNGTSETLFGSALPVNAAQFITILLRVLGYSDTYLDFSWSNPYSLSDSIGLTYGDYSDQTDFRRSDMAILSYRVLNVALKNSEQKLLEQMGEVSIQQPEVDIVSYQYVEKDDELYTTEDTDARLYMYNGELYFMCGRTEFLDCLLLATNRYDITYNGNPYVDGTITIDKSAQPYARLNFQLLTIHTCLADAQYKEQYAYRYNGRELLLPDDAGMGKNVLTVSQGVRFLYCKISDTVSDCFVNLNDFMEFFDISASFSAQKAEMNYSYEGQDRSSYILRIDG